jgi:hypothetical protein
MAGQATIVAQAQDATIPLFSIGSEVSSGSGSYLERDFAELEISVGSPATGD